MGLAFRSAGARRDGPEDHWEQRLEAMWPWVADWRLLQWWPLFALALINAVQDLIAVISFCFWIRSGQDVPAGLAYSLEGVVIAKWVLVIVLVVWLIYRVFTSDASAGRVRFIASALKKQRFSLVIVALLAVIAIGRGTDVLEQFPDVERAWLTWPPSLGWLHLALAVAAQLLLAALLIRLGAMRVQRARDTSTPGDFRKGPSYWPWVLILLAVPALALVLWSVSWADVSWWRVAAVPIVLGVVAIASCITQWAGRTRSAATAAQAAKITTAAQAEEMQRALDENQDAVRTAGDVLAVAVVAVTGLGLVRSFTGAAMVVGSPYNWFFMLAVAVGFAVAALPWPVVRKWNFLERRAASFDRKYDSTGRPGLSPRQADGGEASCGEAGAGEASSGEAGAGEAGSGGAGSRENVGGEASGGGTGSDSRQRSPSVLLAALAAPFLVGGRSADLPAAMGHALAGRASHHGDRARHAGRRSRRAGVPGPEPQAAARFYAAAPQGHTGHHPDPDHRAVRRGAGHSVEAARDPVPA